MITRLEPLISGVLSFVSESELTLMYVCTVTKKTLTNNIQTNLLYFSTIAVFSERELTFTFSICHCVLG